MKIDGGRFRDTLRGLHPGKLSIVDLSIAPEEDEFLESLRGALAIDEARADELAAEMGAAITPHD